MGEGLEVLVTPRVVIVAGRGPTMGICRYRPCDDAILIQQNPMCGDVTCVQPEMDLDNVRKGVDNSRVTGLRIHPVARRFSNSY